MELTPSAVTVLAALGDLAGEAGAGDIAAAADISARTATRALVVLRDAGLLEPAKGGKGRWRLTPAGWEARRQTAAAPASAGAVVDEALDLWAGLGLYAHRAYLELLLAAVVARHHLGTGKPDRHLAFVAVGESGTGKSALPQMACSVFGLDPVAHELLVPAQSPGSVIGRRVRADGGYVWEPAPISGRPLALFDEFDKADEAVRKALMPYLDGRPVVQFEGEAVRLSPTPVLAANPPRSGERYGHIRPEFRRRSVLLDTGYAAHRGADVEQALTDWDDRPHPHLDLAALGLPTTLPPSARALLGSLGNALTTDGRAAKPPQAALEAATLGHAALAGADSEQGVLLSALAVAAAYLTVTEQLPGQVGTSWRADFEAMRTHLADDGRLDRLDQAVAGARQDLAAREVQLARARVAREVEDLELTGAKHELAERLRLASDAIDGRRVPDAVDKSTAAALRAQLRKARDQVLDCRSRGRLADLHAVAAGPLQQAQALRRRIDQDKVEREQAKRQEASDLQRDRELSRHHAQVQRAQRQARREGAQQQLDGIRASARPLEQLWNRRSATAGQPPWRVLEGLGLLRYRTDPTPAQQGALRKLGGVLAGALTGDLADGQWMSPADASVAFRGSRTGCAALAEWGEGARAVLLPALAPLHAQEDELVAGWGFRPRNRPQLYRPQLAQPAAPSGALRVPSQRVPRAALPPGRGY